MSASSGLGGASGQQPLRSAMKPEDDSERTPPASGTLKAVQIEEPTPEPSLIDDDNATHRQFRASHSRRLSGRSLPSQVPQSSKSSTRDDASPSLRPVDEPLSGNPPPEHGHGHRHKYYSEKLLSQVSDWIERERLRMSARKQRSRGSRRKSASPTTVDDDSAKATPSGRERSDSIDSQSSDVSLDKLQRILDDSMAAMGLGSISRDAPKISRPRHRKRRSSLQRTASSDTDYVDGDAIVPDCDVWLDNSKTMAFSTSTVNLLDTEDAKSRRDHECWITFKNEIIRTAHTLRLKGWRRVPLDSGESIDVERLSGALTNAVYVVTPPTKLEDDEQSKKKPAKLLLRIYGPQADNLIDRENELKVLQRLARKKIGPRLLGTFRNGRFEQYFNASPLTPAELRDPDVSKQIAKRMRELHDGVEVLDSEREAGPAVWKNWNCWLDNVSRIVTYLDKQYEETTGEDQRRNSVVHNWKTGGYVLGLPWAQFLAVANKYREWLVQQYGDAKSLNDGLVFAHNDQTQYGNILRFKPDDEKSPLLQPANKHKQLIVIDFEYSAASRPGQEFANHFTEWMYNYHDAKTPWALNTAAYPKLEEQRRFLKAYVDHRPQFPLASSTPKLRPQDAGRGASTPQTPPTLTSAPSTSSIVDFMLDSRAPPGGWSAAERAREERTDQQVRALLEETRLWRPANSLFWAAWGCVQAKVPGLETGEPLGTDAEEEDDEFDYLSYSQDRALFFWGDLVQLGLIQREELPEPLRSRIKLVDL
ncbi:putative choline kinase [Emericellopsis atlantica]|uniref:Choline kinase n=1 Tax=Emericellopsis atlantica TaxID=2614577 RepID=A0A9P7ZTW8_9HYPO|nr:putative choline kinase [Emericellopsis atlantica]KAG9257751.1 putative choline kinase [Emericellopsis atlantica]